MPPNLSYVKGKAHKGATITTRSGCWIEFSFQVKGGEIIQREEVKNDGVKCRVASVSCRPTIFQSSVSDTMDQCSPVAQPRGYGCVSPPRRSQKFCQSIPFLLCLIFMYFVQSNIQHVSPASGGFATRPHRGSAPQTTSFVPHVANSWLRLWCSPIDFCLLLFLLLC